MFTTRQTLLATANTKSSIPQIDHAWQGDEIHTMKDCHITRMMFHNVNGLSTQGVKGIDMFAHDQATLQVDIQGFSEHCLDTTKFRVSQDAQAKIHQNFPGQTSLQLSSSTEPAINNYKPGGTGILALGAIVGRQEPRGKGGDPMGRWSYLHLRRKDSSPVTIISAYQVCPRPTNVIGNTAYHQQLRSLQGMGRHHTHPRQAFIQDLGTFIAALQNQGHDIILGGDFNESLEDKHSGILKLLTSHGLVDPFLHRHPNSPGFGTHMMGHRRIDMILLSARLLRTVRKIGYAPYHYSTLSDHRPIIIEFDTQMLFGYQTHPMTPASTRLVKSKDKKAVSTFITKWYEEVSQRKGFSLWKKIDNDTATPEEVEMVDNIIGTSGDIAENSCKRRRPEFFSNQLVQQRMKVSILRGHLNSLKMGKDRSMQLTQKMRRSGLDFTLPTSQKTTAIALRQASRELQQTCQKHAETRQAELFDKIEAAVQQGRGTRGKILRAIQKAEDTQRTYRILQAMKRRALEHNSIDRVEIPESWPPPDQPVNTRDQLEDPKTATEWRMITDPQEVEYYLLLRNRLHFGQAEGTPFTQEPLNTDLDWAATTNPADQVITGTYTTTSSVPNCQDLLSACQAVTELDQLPAEISAAEFRGKIQTWRESTTTSPSGRHLGRYKALFATGSLEENDNSEEDTPLRSKQEALMKLIVSIINYCIRKNYVLERWKTIVNMMIFKEHGNFKIHRLRVIHLYEADFNLLLAVKWRQLLRSADEKNLINEGQYGGRPGCEAQSLTLLEELKYDLAYLTRRTLVNFDNDASSCYDRIIVPLASIINRKYGLHRQVVAVHANTLHQARFHLKTASGLSSTNYSHCHRFPIHGTGQGSGNSPCIWLIVSSTLFDIHRSLCHGASFTCPEGKNTISFHMVGFVDDSTGTSNDFRPQTEASLDEILHQMEHDAQVWNNLLYCSGGKLELAKCSYHVLTFQFKPNGTPQPSIDTYEHQIQVTDLETNERIPISSKRAFDPHKTLGHFKSPTTKLQTELQHIQIKANRIALLIGTSPLTRHGAQTAYHTVYIPSVKYTLPQSYFPKAALEQAQASSMPKIISKCGFNRNTAKALLYAPVKYSGGGFLPWHLLQGEGQVQHFLKHWRTDTIVSRTLRIAMAWAQWQSGHHQPIMSDPDTPIPYLECRWITSLRDFLKQIKAKLYVDQPMVVPGERKNDIYIMTYARQCGLFTNQDLRIINYCRLYLHATTVSELFDADGTKILPELYACQREPWFNPATYITLQRRPSAFQIRMKWQRLCRQWSDANGHIAASMNLGRWERAGHQQRRRRQTYTIPSNRLLLYHWHIDCYWEYRQEQDHSAIYRPSQRTSWTPTRECLPIKVTEHANGTLSSSQLPPRHQKLPPNVHHVAKHFHEYVEHLPIWDRHLLQGLYFCTGPYEILHTITKQPSQTHLLAVSDGSLDDKSLYYGWVLGTAQRRIFVEQSGRGYGELTSHRAEGWGMLSVARFLYHLFQYTSGHTPELQQKIPIDFISDNQGLVTRINQRLAYARPYPNATLAADWDLVEQIVHTFHHLPQVKISVEWVRGHQDTSGEELTVEAEYNIRADFLAGQRHAADTSPDISQLLLPASRCILTINEALISSNYTQTIRTAYTLPAFHQYLQHRYGWTRTQTQQIDWQRFHRAASNSTFTTVQLVKLVHGKLPTNSELAKSNPHHSPTCHYCPETETFHHLCLCQNPASTLFRREILKTITDYMTTKETPESFQQAFLSSLHNTLNIPMSSSTSPLSPEAIACVTEQQQLGPSALLQGFWTQRWHKLFIKTWSYYTLETPSDPTTFLAGLGRLIWKAQYKLWETHLKAINSDHIETGHHQNTKVQQYKIRIRILHAKQPLCLHGHREIYFYPDVEQFLATATITQMRNYIHHYEPAITASIKAATIQPRRTIFTFPGYRRDRSLTRRPPAMTRTPPGTVTQAASSTSATRGILLHRNHTRWRAPAITMKSIRDFFTPKPK